MRWSAVEREGEAADGVDPAEVARQLRAVLAQVDGGNLDASAEGVAFLRGAAAALDAAPVSIRSL